MQLFLGGGEIFCTNVSSFQWLFAVVMGSDKISRGLFRFSTFVASRRGELQFDFRSLCSVCSMDHPLLPLRHCSGRVALASWY